ncbi:hypothetical protein QIH95_25155 [Bradyrhizobium japonicum]|nr:hypothetical protein QIH95_25155 [Bradyrhizobium japonicum]
MAMLPAPNLTGRARRGLLWAHRWLGLLGGIVVVLIGLTGSSSSIGKSTPA